MSLFIACDQGPAAAVPTSPSSSAVAITDVTLVTLEGQHLAHQSILIRDNKIESVGADAPRDVRAIDGRGLYAMAGLSDMHVHLGLDPEKWMPLFLTCGVTTVMNLHGGPADLAIRERVRMRELVGPRVFTAGPYANEPTVKTPEDATRLVMAQKKAGYDVVKIHGELSREAYEQLVTDGAREGIAVLGHLPRKPTFDDVLAIKQRSVVHAEEILYSAFATREGGTAFSQERVDEIAPRVRDAKMWIVPTVVTQRALTDLWGRPGEIDAMTSRLPGARFLTTDLRLMWHDDDAYGHRDPKKRARITELYEQVRAVVRSFHASGVRMTLGTDAPLPGLVPGWSLIEEIDLVSELGFDRREALRAATIDAGEYALELVPATKSLPFGRIQPGYRGDVVLLARDPVAAPFTCDDVRTVVTQGTIYNRSDLVRMRAEVAATPSLVTEGTQIDTATLVAHTGIYDMKEWSLTVTIDNGVLVASDPSGRRMRLAARTASSFRALDNLSLITVDFVGNKLVFEAEDDERLELVKRRPTSSEPAESSPPARRAPSP
jgi:imidazolonepropionase-like amidohydrolase